MIWQLLTNSPVASTGGITTGGQIIIALLSTIGVVLVALIQSNRRETKRATEAAESAGESAGPSHSAFELDVKSTLTHIRNDIGGLREELRGERKERYLLAEAVSRLIEKEK